MDLQEEFNKLNAQKALLIGVGIAVLYYFLFFDSGEKTIRKTQAHKSAVAEKEVTLAKIRRALDDKQRYESDILEIETNIKDFQKFFVNDTDQNALVKHISVFAELSDISVERMKPVDKESEFPKYREIAVEFEVEGNFHNIMEFISLITAMNRAVDFSQMEFVTVVEGDFPVVRLKTVLVVYTSQEGEGKDANA